MWGARAWTSAPFRRQRFRCTPFDGASPHTFSMNRRRAAEGHPEGEACGACDLIPGAAQGPLSPVEYLHSGVELAHLLSLVAGGASLRAASATVRLEAQRFVRDEYGLRHASREHVLAARYLDLFGATIERQLAPRGCPRIVVLDAAPLGLHPDGEDPGSAVFAAVGADAPGQPLTAWRIDFAPDESIASWADFLAALDGGGPGPDWVVADGSAAIAAAVAARWPAAQLYACEFHLRGGLLAAAGRDAISAADPAAADLFRRALWSDADWAALGDWIIERGARHLADWYLALDDLVRAQIELRRRFPGYPRSNGPAEAVLRWIGGCLDRRRRNGLRNAKRLHLVLALMRAHHAGQADVGTLATIVKPLLRSLPAGFHFAWTALHDQRAEGSSIAAQMRAARGRAAGRVASRAAGYRLRVLRAAVEAANVELAAAGAPPLVARIRPGHRSASVPVRGKWLERDFPLVARDWDAAANDRPLETVRAGSAYRAHWRCSRCSHRWAAEVVDRTSGQRRCPRCAAGRADETTSLAACHPELLAEWHPSANGSLRPEAVRADRVRGVIWRCPADPAHPPYRMAPLTRARRAIGCPICSAAQHASGGRRSRRHREPISA